MGDLENMEFNQTIEFMDKITIVFAFVTMIGVFWGLYKSHKQRMQEVEKIKIFFDVAGVEYLLNLDMPRKHISRSEVQGVLAAFQTNCKSRYSIEYLSDISFLDEIYLIQNNQLNKLLIKLNTEEFSQFSQDKMSKQ